MGIVGVGKVGFRIGSLERSEVGHGHGFKAYGDSVAGRNAAAQVVVANWVRIGAYVESPEKSLGA
jgi:hypothetical protein